MIGNLRTILKTNKTVIIVSIFTSVFTIALLIILIGIITITQKDLFNKRFISLLSNYETVLDKNSINHCGLITGESSVTDIVEKTNKAVVSIIISKNVPIMRYYDDNSSGNDFFNYFFGNGFGLSTPQYREKGIEKKDVGGGSGFFISSDGLLVTNRHVVADNKADYTVLTNEGKKYSAEILASDSALDIAILKVKGNDFSYLSFGNSDLLKPGQIVIAIGNALAEFRNSVSVGVVSGLSRSIIAGNFSGRPKQLDGIIQTDAAINPGNSGGPLLDLNGNVIGINVAIEQGAENIGFALPANAVKIITDSVKEHGEIIRPDLGVRYVQITEELKNKNNLSVDYGVLVIRGQTPTDLAVIPGSPADKSGIEENDIILEIDGVKLEQDKSLASVIRQKKVG